MTENRIKISTILNNQLPSYAKEEFPLIQEFLKQYYLSQEFKGSSADLIQNIDQYVKIDNITNLTNSVNLLNDITIFDEEIVVSSDSGTLGFPDSYGLIQIDNEIITYKSKTETSFLECIRGFSGVTSLTNENNQDKLTFSTSNASEHKSGATIINLSNLFLIEFLKKAKVQLLPGFEGRQLFNEVNESLFIKNSKDFYKSKGTDESFLILFRALYGEEVVIIKPKEHMISPSNAQYLITNDFVVESISGDPRKLVNQTLYQDEYANISKAYAPITNVENIISELGKVYYKLSIDSGYNRDVRVFGITYGDFSVHPKTKVIGRVTSQNSTIDVDSTVGFESSGDLYVIYNDGTEGKISYKSKSLTQFFGCSNISGIIEDRSDISVNTFAYAKVMNGTTEETIKVRINSILSKLNIVDDTFYQKPGEDIIIKSLGKKSDSIFANNWIFNIPIIHNVLVGNISVENSLENTYRVTLTENHIFRKGDPFIIIGPTSESSGIIEDVVSEKVIIISGQGQISLSNSYKIKKNLLKVNSSKYQNILDTNTNVQNVYLDEDKLLVSSQSLPTYFRQTIETYNNSITFSGSFPPTGIGNTDTFRITQNSDHGFYTGDIVYYTPEKINVAGEEITISSLFNEGIYYIKRVDQNSIKLAKSPSEIERGIYVSTISPEKVNNNKLELYKYYNKKLTGQNLLREISPPINDGNSYSTNIGPTGILVNGTEILNYKSSDFVYYGQIEHIFVTSQGQDYDIINPPVLHIDDEIGVGATGFCSVSGDLREIRVVDPGFDYLETPSVIISGGNGSGAKASVSMKSITHEVSFNATSSDFVGVGATVSTIGFSTYHKFRNAEKVIYITNSQSSVGGLTTSSSYYVSVVDPFKIKFHNTENDAISGINTVTITSYGKGTHTIQSFNPKKIVGSINVESSGIGYQNKKKTASLSGINTSLNLITIIDHEFNSGEIIKYISTEIPIGGLISNGTYYVTAVDKDNFRLSEINSNEAQYNYKTKQYVDLTSVGIGTHIFNYPEITVEIKGAVGISSVSGNDFKAKIQPIFRGSITSVHVSEKGSKYGSSEILNYDKQPEITLNSGSGGLLNPIVVNGAIVEVLVDSSGKEYNSPPDLVVNGSGFGAVLTPIIENGRIIKVNVIESGTGYNQSTTTIDIIPAGNSAKFRSNIKKWTVNLFSRYYKNISLDDGILFSGSGKYGLEFAHLYLPRKLREILYTTDKNGKIVYSQSDIKNDTTRDRQYHSPIIGWAYDGNPIYGPYGYSRKSGGIVTQLKSGYVLDPDLDRPNFSQGFFVEDYKYKQVSDESVLDEHNGRFCVTPEFPNGTYAYFATFDLNIDNSEYTSPFFGYKPPTFPFIIGNTYKSIPNKFNFIKSSNQEDYNLYKTKWIRNTTPYDLEYSYSYPYINQSNISNKVSKVGFTSTGVIDSIQIVNAGEKYKVNDILNFTPENTSVSARVSRIKGKPVNKVSVASTSIYNVEFYQDTNNIVLAVTPNPHELSIGDFISVTGLNTTSSSLTGSYRIGVTTNTLALSSTISNSSVTGIVTFFNVTGNLDGSRIRENDILKINSEKVKVLNIDRESSRIRVLREIDGTVGTAHSATDILYENSRKLSLSNAKLTLDRSYKINKELYFNPKESIYASITGIGSTVVISNPGVGASQVFIPIKSIYLPNHNLNTGDELTYSSNGGSEIQVSSNGVSSFTIPSGTKVYAAKITNDFIGISTVKVGLGSTGSFVGIASTQRSQSTLYFTNYGTQTYHSFETNYPTIKGQLSKNLVTVSTGETHGLINGNAVYVNVNPGISTSIVVKYNDYNRKLVINPRDFVSAGVNTESSTITIKDHGFTSGQKVIYNSNAPSQGLENNRIYYVIIVDKDNINLSTNYVDSISSYPNKVSIFSSSAGTISPINPPIFAYKNSIVNFDLSDSSLSYTSQSTRYPAFNLEFYEDENFTKLFDSTKKTSEFQVRRFGRVGITSDASVSLVVDGNIPTRVYYKLVPIYDGILPAEKSQIDVDNFVSGNNQIVFKSSEYNGKHIVSIASSTSFTYNLTVIPENSSYISSTSSSILEYETDSLNAYGPISKIDILNRGKNLYTLPGVSSVTSISGFNALLEPSSKNIGKINKVKIDDIGFDFPSDTTLRPNTSIPQIAKVVLLFSFESIEITSFGKGYTVAPKLIVLDSATNTVVPDIDIRYKLGDNQVTILKNTFDLNEESPRIIPIQNSNGIGISSVFYNKNTKLVTLTLSKQFSVNSDFPFNVGDKIFIENISVGIATTGKGYNSSDYNYEFFTITSTNPNLGFSNPTITYSLNDFLKNGEVPGNFDPNTSSGKVILQKNLPTFNSVIKRNAFLDGEEITTSDSKNGTILSFDKNTNYARISSIDIFSPNTTIKGTVSSAKARIVSVDYFDSYFEIGPFSTIEKGWTNYSGFLSDNLQRIQDSDYYQNFSYSIKSRIEYDKWKDVVSTLNHTAGFKKFSDYQLETSLYYNNGIINGERNSDKRSLIVGISTNLTSCEVINDIVQFVNLNCVYDFDLVSENAIQFGSSTISDEIVFSSRILNDYFESVGNRVLLIDDISTKFNSFPRSTNFSEIYRFVLSESRAQKSFIYVRDKRFTAQRQLLISTLLHNNSIGFLNQYGRIETAYDMGSFDFSVEGTEGVLYFYPNNFTVNDYDITTVTYNLLDNFTGVGTTNIGGVVELSTSNKKILVGSSDTIVGVSSSYTSLKVLVVVSVDGQKHEFDELNLVHDGQNIELLKLLEYGQLTTHSSDQYSSSGLGTYNAYYSGSQIKIDFIPTIGIGVTAVVNSIQVSIANTNSVGVGTFDYNHLRMESNTVSIASSTSPVETVISSYPNEYESAYYILQVSDMTNNYHQLSEVVLIDDGSEIYFAQFGYVDTIGSFSGIGTIGAIRDSVSKLTFTPEPNIDVQIKYFVNEIKNENVSGSSIEFGNATIKTGFGNYFGTERDVKKTFDLSHKTFPIFKKSFEGNNSQVINISSNTVSIPNHFFVTGEEVTYTNPGTGSSTAIGIATTSIAGVGVTDKLPSSVYIAKVNDNLVRLCASADDALQFVPKTLDITSVGVGTDHSFISKNQNSKVLITIDNIIQSPVVSTAITSRLSNTASTSDNIIYFSGITSFFGGDLIKIGDEIMKIEGVGIGSTNAIRVRRPWLGTSVSGYSTNTLVTKVKGNYNIVDNTITFEEAPYGNVPQQTSLPDERDWLGISTSSSFQGRVFLRSGVINSGNEPYTNNYIFDDVSEQFNSVKNEFALTSNKNNITGFYQDNAIILINDIFQQPGQKSNYTLNESGGKTNLLFDPNTVSITNDIGISSLPKGGIIVSVGSSEGFGYQPLVSAAGTAIVSIAGTIQSIGIGNSGSGYRKNLQTVRVGVFTDSTGDVRVEFIGTAVVSNGNVVSIAVTNPGTGYTSTNPPNVIFDPPLSYSDIPLIYSSSSSGFGTEATIDIVVGQGSSVIDFEIKNLGYGYGQGEELTIPINGNVGIPTVSGSNFKEFKIFVDRTTSDKFSGWSVGELQPLDNIESLFDGTRVSFPLILDNSSISIIASKGSKVNIQDTLLVFINDILQVPGKGYLFSGGSVITFTEAPKVGDKVKILFYKGTGSVDVVFRDIMETVKVGDSLTIGYDSYRGQSQNLQEDTRSVTDIVSTNVVDTNTYFGPGNTSDETLLRPVLWCRQTEDKIINEQEVGKNRSLYNALVYPSSYLIKSVGIGSTIIFVDNIRPFFNPNNETTNREFQKNITIVSQRETVGSYATCTVSIAGTISSINLLNGGSGYSSSPTVTIQNPIGVGTTAIASASISSGVVTSITITNPGFGYSFTNPPVVLIEPPKPYSENLKVLSFEGDFGIIVGVGTTTVGVASTGVVFDLLIGIDSFLRDSSVSGVTTVSGISTGYYFTVYNSNITNGLTSLNSDGSVIGIGTTFLDNVYQVASKSVIQKNIPGIGLTYITRVTSSVSNFNSLIGIASSDFYGEFSWGRIVLSYREKDQEYNAYPVGITTGDLVNRTVPLKTLNYI